MAATFWWHRFAHTCQELAESAAALSGCRCCAVYVDSGGEVPELAVATAAVPASLARSAARLLAQCGRSGPAVAVPAGALPGVAGAALVVPIPAADGGQPEALMVLADPGQRRFDPRDTEVATLVARAMGMALGEARKAGYFEILAVMGRGFKDHLTIRSRLEYLIHSLLGALPMGVRMAVALRQNFGEALQVELTSDPPPPDLLAPGTWAGVQVERVMQGGNPLLFPRASAADGPPAPSGVGAAALAPVLVQGRTAGCLFLTYPESHRFEPDEVRLLVAVADQVGLAVGDTARFEESLRDGLTGLFNRLYFEQRFPLEVAEAVRYKRNLTVMMIDVDHFKRINDTHGHLVGDQVLRAVGDLLRRRTRTSDVAARYGGEELVVLLPETDADAAEAVAERLRAEVSLATAPPVTVSIGLATCPANAIRADDLLHRADQALYESKQLGRNRVTPYLAPPPAAPGA